MLRSSAPTSSDVPEGWPGSSKRRRGKGATTALVAALFRADPALFRADPAVIAVDRHLAAEVDATIDFTGCPRGDLNPHALLGH
jgi:hypothetical protein